MPRKNTPELPVEVIRSKRRVRTVSARLIDGRVQIRIPESMSKNDEQRVIAEMSAKAKRKTQSTADSNEQLFQRAQYLNRRYLDGKANLGSIKWVTNQRRRWGSCSQSTGVIRISHRLKEVPDYVLDSVIIHELVHTFIHSGHSKEFWEWADRAPYAERAKGFLEAMQRVSG
ncbi:M48 family metallopeptidase [Corynebacterium pseudotuberculosis]|uniref:M48 metallopeptidase family protein n=1 Tax=Corynebacterium pseudotuberculosis TaxID=1719 RepID=UPI00023247E7|nr:M48 family metallopeptidase [Corynebacterium pseudotuberculosis]AER68626.1 Hypothetical protein Cp106_0536 [Corynebacterium pseudotuberculosis 1/06-A]AFB71887.1 DUF45 domain-containing protein [Corynebacterium pseudotuberculosis 316]AMN69606.1 DUF45 domain-containing protein [Corynebacterium pseudotuberculosis]AMN71457.1 metal-dependent hydrolase [Corynebacterium pseudotuberculosis]AMN73888.1 DUF45 domain-containing protein [Corynebacterium pseudotuberculosis]